MIRSVRTRNSRLGRMFRRIKPAGAEIVLNDDQFKIELKKEVYRSDRREFARDLGLVRLKTDAIDIDDPFFDSPSFSAVLDRLRISDTIGWYQGDLSILLPESNRVGTVKVASEITTLLADSGVHVDAEVSTYPFDDELVALSDEVKALCGEVEQESKEEDDDDNDPLTGGGRRDGRHRGVPAAKSKNFSSPKGQEDGQKEEVLAFQEAGNVQVTTHRFLPVTRTPWWKRGVDIVGAGAGLTLLSPLLLVAAVSIKCSSKGPIFFLQNREGKDGHEFGILKFRTMVVNAEELQKELLDKSEQDGPAFKLTDDPRVTKVGKYLRRSCIDELPQLWNVLKGDMSLVGPRPLPVKESLACTAWQRARLSVLPGLTCTWQAYGGRDVKFAQWMQMDLDYIKRRSFFFDLRLIFDTACIALLHRGSV